MDSFLHHQRSFTHPDLHLLPNLPSHIYWVFILCQVLYLDHLIQWSDQTQLRRYLDHFTEKEAEVEEGKSPTWGVTEQDSNLESMLFPTTLLLTWGQAGSVSLLHFSYTVFSKGFSWKFTNVSVVQWICPGSWWQQGWMVWRCSDKCGQLWQNVPASALIIFLTNPAVPLQASRQWSVNRSLIY